MPNDEDKSLWELYGRCQYGTPGLELDRERFDAELDFYNSLAPVIITYARGMGFSHHDAEDITQEVFVTIARKALRREEIKSGLRAYCIGIARYKAIKLLKERKLRLEDISEHQELAADFPAQGEDEENLVMARSNLKYSFQEVLTLYYDYDMTAAEVAVVLNEPVKRVESRKRRALQALSKSLRFVREKNQIK